MSADCMVAICDDGIMRAAAVIVDGSHIADEAVAEWARDPKVIQILRVPVEIPRRFLFAQWPGLESAKAILALEASDA